VNKEVKEARCAAALKVRYLHPGSCVLERRSEVVISGIYVSRSVGATVIRRAKKAVTFRGSPSMSMACTSSASSKGVAIGSGPKVRK
jgi:hypothetical protein